MERPSVFIFRRSGEPSRTGRPHIETITVSVFTWPPSAPLGSRHLLLDDTVAVLRLRFHSRAGIRQKWRARTPIFSGFLDSTHRSSHPRATFRPFFWRAAIVLVRSANNPRFSSPVKGGRAANSSPCSRSGLLREAAGKRKIVRGANEDIGIVLVNTRFDNDQDGNSDQRARLVSAGRRVATRF
jgi:hypothetical protein